MTKPIPDYVLDIFTPEAVVDARAVDDALREFAPVVRLADGTVMLARHEHVSAGLLDWKTFSSASRPWHDPASPRPEILLTDDPPRHTQTRKVIADPQASYFGARLDDRGLNPGANPRIGPTRLNDWLGRTVPRA